MNLCSRCSGEKASGHLADDAAMHSVVAGRRGRAAAHALQPRQGNHQTHELSTIRTYPIVMKCSMDAGAGHST